MMMKLNTNIINGRRILALNVDNVARNVETGKEKSVVMMMLRANPLTEVSDAPKLLLILE